MYNIFIKPKKIEFRLKDVKVPDIPAMFTTFKVKEHIKLTTFRTPVRIFEYKGNFLIATIDIFIKRLRVYRGMAKGRQNYVLTTDMKS